MEKSELKEIILDQQQPVLDEELIKRDVFDNIETYVKNQFIVVITGIRRCGKSTLLQQIRKK